MKTISTIKNKNYFFELLFLWIIIWIRIISSEFVKIELGAFLIGALVLKMSENVHMGFHQVLKNYVSLGQIKKNTNFF